MLQGVAPGEFYFVSSSKSESGKSTTECEQCLNYRGYLSKKFFVAIDSDLRYPLQESGLDSVHYVAQTYTYSWENHYCEANGLQKRFEKAVKEGDKTVTFDFKIFLEKLSHLLFLPFVYVIYNECNESRDSKVTVKTVFGCLPSQVERKWLDDNGEVLLNVIKQKIDSAFPLMNSCCLTPTISRMKLIGITEDNVYLHVRGHNLFDMLRSMGKILCRGSRISFTKDVLLSEINADESYWQLRNTKDDLRSILSL